MAWLDDLTSFVRGAVSGFVGEYSSPSAYTPSAHAPPRATFQSVIQHLASEFNADVHWDEDGDMGAALGMHLQGDYRMVMVFFADGRAHLYAPSNIKFAPGCLPRDIAAFLVRRNKELDFADWDAVNKNGKACFTLRSHGPLDRITLDTLKVAIKKMLIESATLDSYLRKEGYVA